MFATRIMKNINKVPGMASALLQPPLFLNAKLLHQGLQNQTTMFRRHFFNLETKSEFAQLIPNFLRSEISLYTVLNSISSIAKDNYLFERFIYWLSAYAKDSPVTLQNYFLGICSLDDVCRDYIKFCFSACISLDPEKTLQAFDFHNRLSDAAVKTELVKIKPKEEINLLGFGCDDGSYEKSLAEYLLAQGKANTVKIFGFDPYAKKSPDIEYFRSEQLTENKTPVFDVITARWVLHHVALKNRWQDLINCINRCNSGASVLIVEHGFLKKQSSIQNKKLSDLLNATFDIIANIGLRPRYFTDTAPDLGANFFIHYLEPKDFEAIKQGVSVQTTQSIYDVGPGFPNQTICSMRTSARKP